MLHSNLTRFHIHSTVKLHFRTILIGLAIAGATFSHGANIAFTQFIFDDFRTPYSSPVEGDEALQPGVMEVTALNPHQVVIDTLNSGDTVGATRKTTLDIDPDAQLGDLTLFTASASGNLPPRLSLNADFLTAGRVVTEYDFSPIGESVNAAADTTHVIIDLISTDNRPSSFEITFTDVHGTTVTRDIAGDLGADLTIPGPKLFPFEDFANIDFTQLTGFTTVWDAGIAYDGEIAIIATGFDSVPAVPEPSSSLLLLLGSITLLARRQR